MTEFQKEVLLRFCKHLKNSLSDIMMDPQEILKVAGCNGNEGDIAEAILYLTKNNYIECLMNSDKWGNQFPSTLKLTTKAIDFANINQP